MNGKAASIKREALKREEIFDGKYFLSTNSDLPTDQIALAYKGLWKVERAFRELKSGLDLRTNYHWKRQPGKRPCHGMLFSFGLRVHVAKKLRDTKSGLSYRKVIKDLIQMQAVKMSYENQDYLTRSELQGEAYMAFKAVGTRPPKHMQLLNEYGQNRP